MISLTATKTWNLTEATSLRLISHFAGNFDLSRIQLALNSSLRGEGLAPRDSSEARSGG
jgi:hypothetical protein